MNIENKINELLRNFTGKISLYSVDDYNNEIKINENIVVETASCIKIFILVEYYNQILKGLKSRDDLIKYNKESDYVENGSGLIQYLDNLTITSKNMAILMMIVSDNIATNKIIDYLGFNNINNTIEQLGFKNTKLVCQKLDFKEYNSLGKTTAYEYAKLYKMILDNEILTPTLCKEILQILKNQAKNEMLIKYLPPEDLDQKGTDNSVINYIASKSGGLGNEGRNDIINCRNDGGIISTKFGNYIVSIFIYDFKDPYFYSDNPASILGARISALLYNTYIKNNGKFKI